jgi:hypothetical protein
VAAQWQNVPSPWHGAKPNHARAPAWLLASRHPRPPASTQLSSLGTKGPDPNARLSHTEKDRVIRDRI